MKVLLFGATGMVGQSVLRECLLAADVARITSVGRSRLEGIDDPRLEQVVHADMAAPEPIADRLRGHDACFFCLGVSSVGMDEARYTRLTHALTMAVARVLVRDTPSMAFAYVSGAGTDRSERGPRMWARVKGRVENELMGLGFARVFLFRPGVIQPLHAVRSKTAVYRLAYAVVGPFLSLAKRLRPAALVTSEEFGRAMLEAVRRERGSAVLEVADIVRLGRAHEATPGRPGGA